MTRPHPEDRGVLAVRRVHSSREQDSRLGLSVALTAVRHRTDELAMLRAARAGGDGFELGSVGDFAAYVARRRQLAEAESLATERLADSELLADEATRRWQSDRQQVRVVDGLLERRAATRAEERARVAARELDDLASQGWLRRQAEQRHHGGRR